MICTNCGKSISIIGKVCPYCHADKSADVSWFWVLATCVMFFAVVGAIVGYALALPTGPLRLMTVPVGIVVGGILGALSGTLIRLLWK